MINFYQKLKQRSLFLDTQITSLNENLNSYELPNILLHALISAEDHRFPKHHGVDTLALIRATWKTFFRNERQGGSTIAMQLVRTLTGDYERTISRKLIEVLLALRIARKISKRSIAKMYLNVAYFGWNTFGVEQVASKLSLNISLLNESQAAEIIARLKYPEGRFLTEKRANQINVRTRYILKKMNKNIQYYEKNKRFVL